MAQGGSLVAMDGRLVAVGGRLVAAIGNGVQEAVVWREDGR